MKCRIEENVLIRDYSYIGIGGKSKFMAFPDSVEELIEVLSFVEKNNLTYKIAGMMSNTLYSDNGYEGIIINTRNLKHQVDIERNRIVIKGDMKVADLMKIAEKENIMDIAFLAGIPGMVMSAVKVNAGAWGKDVSDIVEWVEVLENNGVRKILREDIKFDYRYSDIKGIIVSVSLMIGKEEGNVKEYIKEKIAYRLEKHPTERSLGSVFKNPKPLIAGKLIEECGLKGMRIGDVMVSDKHGNFIVNIGKGSSKDMIELIKVVRETVKREKGINLKLEIEVIDEKGQKILV